jgi:hypothetical protein
VLGQDLGTAAIEGRRDAFIAQHAPCRVMHDVHVAAGQGGPKLFLLDLPRPLRRRELVLEHRPVHPEDLVTLQLVPEIVPGHVPQLCIGEKDDRAFGTVGSESLMVLVCLGLVLVGHLPANIFKQSRCPEPRQLAQAPGQRWLPGAEAESEIGSSDDGGEW